MSEEVPAPVGRPSNYEGEETDTQAQKLCKLGATDSDIADFFEVSEQTINTWKFRHPSFLESIKRSKQELDETVVRSLFHRARGYSHPEDKIFCNNGVTTTVKTTKHYPPDTGAMVFWLKNRQKDQWRDRIDNMDDPDDVLPPTTVTIQEVDARQPDREPTAS